MAPRAATAAAGAYQRGKGDPQLAKRAINGWIAACARSARQLGAALGSAAGAEPAAAARCWALVLESRHLLTVRALCEAACGVCVETTAVPNPDPGEVAAIRQAEPDLLALTLTSHQLLASLTQAASAGSTAEARTALEARGWGGRFSVVWLDYCGTLGASNVNKLARQRLQDVELLLQHHLLGGDDGTPALLAVTFTSRGSNELYRGELLDRLVLTVTGLAQRHGQLALTVGAVSYAASGSGGPPTRDSERPSMHTALFSISAAAATTSDVNPGINNTVLTVFPELIAPVGAAVALQYRTGEQLLRDLDERRAAAAAAHPPADVTPLWHAMNWLARAFVESVHSAAPSGHPVALLAVESSTILPVSCQMSSSSLPLLPMTQLHATAPSNRDVCITVPVVSGGHADVDTASALAERLPDVERPQPTLHAALAHLVDKEVEYRQICGVWLGYDTAKPWRARPWAAVSAFSEPAAVAIPHGQRCICDRSCALCATEPWWVDLRCLCSQYLASITSAEGSSAAAQQLNGSDGTLVVGMSLPFAPLVEIWRGAVVDRLLRGIRATLAAHAPLWSLVKVEWVSRYALGSLRVALAVRLGMLTTPQMDFYPEPEHVRERDPESKSEPDHVPAPEPQVDSDEILMKAVTLPPVAQWESCYGWHEERSKEPTPSAVKYHRLSNYICAMVSYWSADVIVLHEPGFHWVLPALQKQCRRQAHPPSSASLSSPSMAAAEIHCHVIDDGLQAAELMRVPGGRMANAKENVWLGIDRCPIVNTPPPAAAGAVFGCDNGDGGGTGGGTGTGSGGSGGGSENCLALVLLLEGGLGSWADAFSLMLYRYLQGASCGDNSVDGGLGPDRVLLLAHVEATSGVEETAKSLEAIIRRATARAEGGGGGGGRRWDIARDVVHMINVQSRRSIFASFVLMSRHDSGGSGSGGSGGDWMACAMDRWVANGQPSQVYS